MSWKDGMWVDPFKRTDNYTKEVEASSLSVRTKNAIIWVPDVFPNVKAIKDLAALDDRQLLRMKNFGKKSLNELRDYFKCLYGESRVCPHCRQPWPRREE